MMPEGDNDQRLRDVFATVHADDRPPAFDDLWRRAGRQPRRPLRLAPVAAALLLVVAASWLYVSTPPRRGDISEEEVQVLAESLSTWKGPTDFLLDTPGREYMESVPAFEIGIPGNGAWRLQQEVLQ